MASQVMALTMVVPGSSAVSLSAGTGATFNAGTSAAFNADTVVKLT